MRMQNNIAPPARDGKNMVMYTMNIESCELCYTGHFNVFNIRLTLSGVGIRILQLSLTDLMSLVKIVGYSDDTLSIEDILCGKSVSVGFDESLRVIRIEDINGRRGFNIGQIDKNIGIYKL